MAKHDIFKKELSYINSETLRNSIIDILDNVVPDYFYEIPASSTGKYHPKYALGPGGLVRHTQAAVRIAADLFVLTNYTDMHKDFIIAALILHDTFKCGETYNKYTKANHPVIAATVYQKYFDEHEMPECGRIISNLIISNMGKWNKDYATGAVIMPGPTNVWQKYVHICDYLASRKYLEFCFDVEVKRE